jgi:hypothetical protein
MIFIETTIFTKLLPKYLTDDEIWLLTLYSKSEKATIPGHILKKIAEEIENE